MKDKDEVVNDSRAIVGACVKMSWQGLSGLATLC